LTDLIRRVEGTDRKAVEASRKIEGMEVYPNDLSYARLLRIHKPSICYEGECTKLKHHDQATWGIFRGRESSPCCNVEKEQLLSFRTLIVDARSVQGFIGKAWLPAGYLTFDYHRARISLQHF